MPVRCSPEPNDVATVRLTIRFSRTLPCWPGEVFVGFADHFSGWLDRWIRWRAVGCVLAKTPAWKTILSDEEGYAGMSVWCTSETSKLHTSRCAPLAMTNISLSQWILPWARH